MSCPQRCTATWSGSASPVTSAGNCPRRGRWLWLLHPRSKGRANTAPYASNFTLQDIYVYMRMSTHKHMHGRTLSYVYLYTFARSLIIQIDLFVYRQQFIGFIYLFIFLSVPLEITNEKNSCYLWYLLSLTYLFLSCPVAHLVPSIPFFSPLLPTPSQYLSLSFSPCNIITKY